MLQDEVKGAACLKSVDVASQDERAVDIDLRAFDVLHEQLVHLPVSKVGGWSGGQRRAGVEEGRDGAEDKVESYVAHLANGQKANRT